MLFASSQKYKTLPLLDLNLSANNEKLKFVTSYKYLDITLDYELNFNQHVKELKRNLAFKSYLLANLKHYVPTSIMLKIYKVYGEHRRMVYRVDVCIDARSCRQGEPPAWAPQLTD